MRAAGIPSRKLDRRGFLQAAGAGLTGVGAAALIGCGRDGPSPLPPPDAPPEVSQIRLPWLSAACMAPMWLARDFFREEGLEPVYVTQPSTAVSHINAGLASGAIDMSLNFAPPLAYGIAAGQPLVIIAAAHPACWEIFARPGINGVPELRGKRIAITDRDPGPADYVFLQAVLQEIGISPTRDVEIVNVPGAQALAAWRRGEFDALFAAPPEAFSHRDTGSFGEVLVTSMHDPPWDLHLCCQVATNRTFVERNPGATRAALRAMLRGLDSCASDPERVAGLLTDLGFMVNAEYAARMLTQIPYGAWRTFDPEASLRFYALKLHEAGLVGLTPEKIIKKGTDWRFVRELQQQLAYFPPANVGSAFALACDTEGPTEG